MTTKPSRTLAQVKREFSKDEACKSYLTKMRWPDGKVACPRCGETKRVYALRTRPFHWVCKNESDACPGVYRFSVLAGTIFENTNVPLRTWFEVLYLMTQSKKGISALQVHRMIDPVRGSTGSYRTAWYMCHRIRAAMNNEEFEELMGVVEIDETYVGGKERNKHKSKRTFGAHGSSTKIGVVGAIARKGNVVAKVIGSTEAPSIKKFVRTAVSSKVTLVATDESPAYTKLAREGFPHETVNHAREEYVRGDVHTQNLDSFWSLLKRGIIGSYHQVSAKYLPFYLAEFSFRHNHRDDADMFGRLIAGC